MLWRLGENIHPSYLQMVILSHIAFVCFSFLFNNVVEKIWTKKKVCDRKRKYLPNCGYANFPINLSESIIKGVKTTFNNPISTNNCRILGLITVFDAILTSRQTGSK